MTDTNKQLKNHVNSIADELSGKDDSWFDYGESDHDMPNPHDYMADALDIEYIVSSSHEYLGARILVAFGGPNIWINTRTNTVEGYWWGSEAFAHFDDELGLDDYITELYECTR